MAAPKKQYTEQEQEEMKMAEVPQPLKPTMSKEDEIRNYNELKAMGYDLLPLFDENAILEEPLKSTMSKKDEDALYNELKANGCDLLPRFDENDESLKVKADDLDMMEKALEFLNENDPYNMLNYTKHDINSIVVKFLLDRYNVDDLLALHGDELHKVILAMDQECHRLKKNMFSWQNFKSKLQKLKNQKIIYEVICELHLNSAGAGLTKYHLLPNDIKDIAEYLTNRGITPTMFIDMKDDKQTIKNTQDIIDKFCHEKLSKVSVKVEHIIFGIQYP